MANPQNPRYRFGREDNKNLDKMRLQDSENPITIIPSKNLGVKFFQG